MSNEYTRIVDQQLAYTRVQLNSARAVENSFSRKACLNACCLHLTETMLAYLSELQVSCVSVKTGSSLRLIFGELQSLPQSMDFRVSELITLACDKKSWLSELIELQLFLRKPLIPEQKRPAADEDRDDPGLIATSSGLPQERRASDFPVAEPAIDRVANILEEVERLVARHREFSAEY